MWMKERIIWALFSGTTAFAGTVMLGTHKGTLRLFAPERIRMKPGRIIRNASQTHLGRSGLHSQLAVSAGRESLIRRVRSRQMLPRNREPRKLIEEGVL